MDRQAIDRLAVQVMEVHLCHTVIIYGSWARGDATSESDVDLLCVRETGTAVRDARAADDLYLDVFVYPESALKTLDPSFLRLSGGSVVRERDGFGSALLARVREMDDRGPPALPDDERQALVVWSQKMLGRTRARRGVEIDYRRMNLLVRALEDYFLLRKAWFRGEKEAFAWLGRHDPATYTLFERALQQRDDSALADLVAEVYPAHPSAGDEPGNRPLQTDDTSRGR